jgi:hypothetical protein
MDLTIAKSEDIIWSSIVGVTRSDQHRFGFDRRSVDKYEFIVDRSRWSEFQNIWYAAIAVSYRSCLERSASHLADT